MKYEHYDSFPEDAVPEGYEVFAQDTPGHVMARKPVGADAPPTKPTRKARKALPSSLSTGRDSGGEEPTSEPETPQASD